MSAGLGFPPEPPDPHLLTWRVPTSRPWSREIPHGTVRLNDVPTAVEVVLTGGGVTVTGEVRMTGAITADRDNFVFELRLDGDVCLHDLLRLFGAAHIEPTEARTT